MSLRGVQIFYLLLLIQTTMETLKSDSLNYTPVSCVKSTYQYSKTYPQESTSLFTVTNTQGTSTTFQIIPNVVNLSKSYLFFRFSVPTQGANNYSWMNCNGAKFFAHMTATIQSGVNVADVNFMDRYVDIISRKVTTVDDALSKDSATVSAAGGNGTYYENLVPNTVATGAVPIRLDGTAANRTLESKYVLASAVNTAFAIDCRISLAEFQDTFFALDKDIWAGGANLTITITWNPLNYLWYGTSATDPSAAAAASTVDATVSNCYLWTAIQQNKEINQSIINRCTSPEGLSINIPFVWAYQQSFATGGLNVQQYYTSANGSKLKKIWWALYPTTPATPNLNFNKSNLAAAKLSMVLTQVNGNNIQQTPLVPVIGEDWILSRDKLLHSDILSANEFYYNWSFCDDFTDHNTRLLQSMWSDMPYDNVVQGLPLDNSLNYAIQATSTADVTINIYAVCMKELRISKNGIVLV